MHYSTNYNLNLPEPADQFNIDDWNANTSAIDAAISTNAAAIATNKSNISTNAAAIATNKSNISAILTGLSTVNASDANSVYYKLMKLVYPVGSVYWSSKSTNPGTLFGGTWTQIKDRFVLAAGDTYSVNATGGAATVTLTTSNMPSHTHTVPAHSHGLNGHTHSMSHTHNVTAAGTVASHTHAFSGTTSGMSGNSTGSFYSSRSIYANGSSSSGNVTITRASNGSDGAYGFTWGVDAGRYNSTFSINVSHTHTYSGTTSSTAPTFTGSSVTTSSISASATGAASGNTANSSVLTSGSNGSGSAVSVLPPYIVKYCWERTA